MNIKVSYDSTGYRLRNKRKTIELINKVIRSERKIPGDLNFIITNDKNLLEINREFLKHNYFTDVIAFGSDSAEAVNGEIYVSADTVSRNAHNYKVSLNTEMLRVLIHGTLHLCGYDDSTAELKNIMHSLEDKWLKEYGGV